MPTQRRKKKIDPFDQHVWHNLAILEWHASYSGPRWKKHKVPYADWRTNEEKIRNEYELEHEDYLALQLLVEAYREPVRVRKREVRRFEFHVYSCTEMGGGLLQICPDGELRGWAHFPIAGVQALLTLLSKGRSIVLEIHASEFKRGEALVHPNGGWSTSGHPGLEDEGLGEEDG